MDGAQYIFDRSNVITQLLRREVDELAGAGGWDSAGGLSLRWDCLDGGVVAHRELEVDGVGAEFQVGVV